MAMHHFGSRDVTLVESSESTQRLQCSSWLGLLWLLVRDSNRLRAKCCVTPFLVFLNSIPFEQ